MSERGDAIVLGAGVVGICCARYLQREGFAVTVVSRDRPGEACSAGNSGGFGVSLIAPVATPGIVWRVPSLWLDPKKPLAIEISLLPRLLPWFVRFVATSAPARYRAASAARAELCARVFEALDPLLRDAGAERLVRREGMMFIYDSEESLAAARSVHDVARAHGVPMEEVDAKGVRVREPALGARARCAVVSPTSRHTTNPLRLVQALAEDFGRRGGRLVEAEALAVEGGARPRVVLESETLAAERLVIAAGAWSGRLIGRLGLRVPLAAERGYHLMAPGGRVRLNGPVTLSDRNVVITPMEHGIRVTGMAEFARIDSPPNVARARRMLAQAEDYVPGLDLAGAAWWMGPRPSTPDSLPVIGPFPGEPRILLAFGHGHMGLAFAAITGRLIASLAAARAPDVDLAPFAPTRFAPFASNANRAIRTG